MGYIYPTGEAIVKRLSTILNDMIKSDKKVGREWQSYKDTPQWGKSVKVLKSAIIKINKYLN